MSVLAVAAVIFGIGYAVIKAGASRVFWALFGYEVGRRRRR